MKWFLISSFQKSRRPTELGFKKIYDMNSSIIKGNLERKS